MLDMRKRVRFFLVCLVLFLVIGSAGVFGASLGRTIDSAALERLNIGNALIGVEYINAWLKSFTALTKLTASQINDEEKAQVGNLGADTQTLGFYNWGKTVEGTLYKQDFDIKRLEYELAKEREAAGKVSSAEVAEKARNYQDSKAKFEGFLARFHIAD